MLDPLSADAVEEPVEDRVILSSHLVNDRREQPRQVHAEWLEVEGIQATAGEGHARALRARHGTDVARELRRRHDIALADITVIWMIDAYIEGAVA